MGRASLISCFIAIAIAVTPAPASARVLSAVEQVPAGLPAYGSPTSPARTITSLASTYDTELATWMVRITFDGPLSAGQSAKLYIWLQNEPGLNRDELELTAWTDPGDLRPVGQLWAKTDGVGTAPATASLSADRRTITLTMTGGAVTGEPWLTLNGYLSREDVGFDTLAPMRLTAAGGQGAPPQLTLPASDATLTERHLPQAVGTVYDPGPAIQITVGWGAVPVCAAARIEVAGQVIAYGGITGLDCFGDLATNPFRLVATPAGMRAMSRAPRLSGELIVEGWSATGLLSIARAATVVTTLAAHG